MSVIMDVKEVSKSYGYNSILDNISFSLDEGSITGIIGKSGCGKSTLLNVMVGFLKPNKGRIYYRGKDLFRSPKSLRAKFGFSSQATSFYNKLTVEENLAYFGEMYGMSRRDIKDKTELLLRMFELEGAYDTLGGELSSGMQKRLDIACALIHDPEVLFLDEPTANLDPMLRKEIIGLIKKIKLSGTTVVITSHILGEIDYLCDKIVILDNKRVIAVDSPSNLVRNYSQEKILKIKLRSKDYRRMYDAVKSKTIRQVYAEDDNCVMICDNPAEILEKILNYVAKTKDTIEGIELSGVSVGSLFESILKKRGI